METERILGTVKGFSKFTKSQNDKMTAKHLFKLIGLAILVTRGQKIAETFIYLGGSRGGGGWLVIIWVKENLR